MLGGEVYTGPPKSGAEENDEIDSAIVEQFDDVSRKSIKGVLFIFNYAYFRKRKLKLLRSVRKTSQPIPSVRRTRCSTKLRR